MDNAARIYRICGRMIDLIETLESYDEWLNGNRTLAWIKEEMEDIREEIDNY